MTNAEYIGREQELRLLRELGLSSDSTLAVVYGRRRVGKSSLISEAFKDSKIYDFEGLENESEAKQLEYFLIQLRHHFPNTDTNGIKGWYEALMALAKAVESAPGVVLFDEFQWMANYRKGLVSILKTVWDKYFSKISSATMILCGSIASFMVNKVLKSKALYGRSSLAIHLKPFKVADTAKFLRGRSKQEILCAQMLVGGIPGYLKLLQTKNSVFLGIQELAFQEHGYFTTEYERIFTSQFGKSEFYEKLVRILSSKPMGLNRNQIVSASEISNGGSLSKYLEDLELAGFITSYTNFNRQNRSKIYRLSDPFLRLYFKFISPRLIEINSGKPNIFITLASSPEFASWLGSAAEMLCFEHRFEISKLLGFSDVEYKVGPFFKIKDDTGPGVQVDLVFARKDKVLTLCEVKYRDTISPSIVQEVEKKALALPNRRGYTVQKVLISKYSVPKSISDRAYFSHMITLDELIEV